MKLNSMNDMYEKVRWFFESDKIRVATMCLVAGGLTWVLYKKNPVPLVASEKVQVKTTVIDGNKVTYKIPDAAIGQPKEIVVENTHTEINEKLQEKVVERLLTPQKSKNQIILLKDLRYDSFLKSSEGYHISYLRRIGDSNWKWVVESDQKWNISAGISLEF